MAVVKRGKIRGKAGSVVFRYSRGQEIIQSAPKKGIKSAITKQQNENFGACAYLNQLIYYPLKAIALNIVDPKLSNRCMKLLMRNFFSHRKITASHKYSDWKRIPKSKNFPLHKGKRIENILEANAKVRINDRLCKIIIPGFYTNKVTKNKDTGQGADIGGRPLIHPKKNRNNNLPKDASYVSFTYLAFLLNSDKEVLILFEHESERRLIRDCSQGHDVCFEIKIGDEYPDNGLLGIVMGIKFFTSPNSFGYLNNQLYNPCSLLGMWYKK